MKKRYMIKNLDCAVCATKLEKAIQKIDGVNEVSISFLSEKMKLVIDETREDTIMNEINDVIHRLEPEVEIIEKKVRIWIKN